LREMLVDLNHVPLFFLTQHFWTRLAGDSEFAARYLSVVAGVLVVALTCRLGRLLVAPSVGIVAAAISAVAPFQVYYSQEARMHIWTTAIGLLVANAAIWALANPDRPRRWGLFVVAGIAGLYTFYYAGFVVAAVSLMAAWTVVARRDWRSFRWLVAANAVIALGFAPWALNLAGALGAQAAHKAKDFVAYDLPNFLHANWKSFIAGVTLNPETLPFPTWPIAIVVGLGLATLSRGRYRLLTPWYLIVPLLGVYGIQARYPHFVPRYLLLATPPFYLMIAAGIVAPFLWRGWGRAALVPVGVATATLIGATSLSLANNYGNPAYFRDDYRGVAAAIHAESQPDDAIVLNAPWQIYNF
ncbi:MAG: glycosyltransferase family 39 protein, partial [Dehalococcoidia bacterium]|nr:glycosyltransferase family 39 protein [Dehalococcoidia bacterium]